MKSFSRILITGGTGFIGFALVKRLISLGYNVRILTRKLIFDKDFEIYLSDQSSSQLEVVAGDIRKSASIRDAFKDVDLVFHVAAMLNTIAPYSEFKESNVSSTKIICELCLEFNINRLIYISTCDVFGLPQKNSVFTESSPYRPWSEPYADTKIEASKLVKSYQEHGLAYTIIYPGWVYGPGDKAFLPSILKQIQSGVMPIWDDGKYKIDMVYIDDIIDSFILAINKEESINEDFLILDDAPQMNMEDICRFLGTQFNIKFKIVRLPYRIAYFIAWISQLLVKVKLLRTPLMSTTDAKSLGLNFRYSANKARELLGWSVKEGLKSGLTKWKLWYVEYSG